MKALASKEKTMNYDNILDDNLNFIASEREILAATEFVQGDMAWADADADWGDEDIYDDYPEDWRV
jgi:hypothetical protein